MLAEWQAVLEWLKGHVEDHSFSAWVSPIQCEREGDGFRLEVASSFARDWISRHLLDTIRTAFRATTGGDTALRIAIVERDAPIVELAAEPRVRREPARRPGAKGARTLRIGRLLEHYTFDHFVVGPSNELAYRAACTVAEGTSRAFNPLFLWGGVGLGKTHLISALAHRFLQSTTRNAIAFLSAEEFMNQMIAALRQDGMRAFRERFRELDLLIVDDVEFLAGKERTQEEFFHTFDALFAAGKQVVLTSDKPPQAIANLAQRLRSRFEGGLNADVRPPTKEMRFEIVRRKAMDRHAELSDGIVRAIVERSGPSVREIEGALTRILAWRDLHNSCSIDEAEAVALLDPVVRPLGRVHAQNVLDAASKYFRIPVDSLRAHNRERAVAEARQIAMYLCRTLVDLPYAAIGHEFGGRDHSTVIYAVRSVESRRSKDARLDVTIAALERALHEAAHNRAA